jgi:hypothetical protein
MDDQELDTLIHDAISVEPSPEFLARVRTNIEERRIERTWSPVWFALSGLVAVSVAVFVALFVRQDQSGTVPARVLAQANATSDLTVGPPPVLMRTNRAMPDAVRSSRPKHSRRMPVVRDDFPKVMISSADAAIFRRFMAGVYDGTFELSPDVLSRVEAVQERDVAITPLSIDPIRPIEPISPIEPLSGQ